MCNIDYYNKNAQEFIENTVDVDFGNMQEKFLTYLQQDSLILALGCGSGRDRIFG